MSTENNNNNENFSEQVFETYQAEFDSYNRSINKINLNHHNRLLKIELWSLGLQAAIVASMLALGGHMFVVGLSTGFAIESLIGAIREYKYIKLYKKQLNEEAN